MAEALSRPEFFGPYVLLDRLGSGAMGDVFVARPIDVSIGERVVVIKRLHPELASDRGFVRRFSHEALIATLIDSPNVARVYDVGRVQSSLYIAMELVEGWTIQRLLKELNKQTHGASIRSIVSIIAGALDGLTAIHEARDADGNTLDVVHRDIAPKNMMLGADGRTRIIDLGLGTSRAQQWKTATGAVLGSPGYMSPEQALGRSVDLRADLYAAGVILFELLSLQPYIERGPVPMMLQRSASPTFRAPSRIRSDIPSALDAVLERALQVDPERRFESARAMRDALLAAAGDTAEPPVASMVSALVDRDVLASRDRIDKLLDETQPELDATQITEPTEIYARRSAVPTIPVLMPAPPPATGVSRALVAGLIVVTSALMFGLGTIIERQRQSPPGPALSIPESGSAPAPRAVSVTTQLDAPAPQARVTKRRGQTPQPRPVVVAPTPTKAVQGAPPAEVIVEPPPMPITLEARVDGLLDRARAKWSGSTGVRRDRAKSFVTELTRLKSSTRLHEEEARVIAIERALNEL